MRPGILAVAALIGLSTSAGAQASQFGIRGLGLPGRELSARSLSLGGASGLLDGESSLNPAALGTLTTATALFTSTGGWRNSTNPVGSASTRDTRFPQILVGGPIPRTPVSIGVSYSLYNDRDFTVVSDGTASPRGVPVMVHDTLSSRGGIDDIRFGAAWTLTPHLLVGAGLHFLAGSNRLASRRFWEDSTYSSPAESAELAYTGTGISLGVAWQPVPHLELGAVFRRDGKVTVSRDSTGSGQVKLPTTTIGNVRMPVTLSGAFRYSATRALAISGSVSSRNWSVADSSLVSQGAPGARNTFEVDGGVELFRDLKRPTKYPLRLGAHYATLPFLLTAGDQPTSYGVSIGTGRRFAQDRGGFDIAVEHVWRSQGSSFTESVTMITFGISVRPGGVRP
jgi:hypothetical protein